MVSSSWLLPRNGHRWFRAAGCSQETVTDGFEQLAAPKKRSPMVSSSWLLRRDGAPRTKRELAKLVRELNPRLECRT
jgi:hypothetical protein